MNAFGIDAVVRDLAKASLTAGVRARAAVEEITDDIIDTAKANARVDTGTMRDSISGTITGTVAEIGPTDPNRAKVIANEYGTSRMGPRPFMGPALDKHTQGFIDKLDEIVGDI